MSFPTKLSFGILLTAFLISCSAPLQASYVNVNINSGANGVDCGSVSPIDPGEPCAGSPNKPTAQLNANYSNASGEFEASALAGYGFNKAYARSLSSSTGIQANTEWMVVYSLAGETLGTRVPLPVEIGYHVTLGTVGRSSAGLRIVINNETLGPYDIFTTTDPFGGDHCFDRPGAVLQGACAGEHRGTFTRTIDATVGPNNRLSLFVAAGTFGSATADAYSTVEILKITVPDGITWEYQGPSGNPLNFQYAANAAVPEPATFALTGLCLGVLGWRKRRLLQRAR